jgi:hypothetical protein
MKNFITNIIKECLREQQILNEGSSDILYHFTYIEYLLNILKNNEFSLTSTLGSTIESRINKKKFFYFSTTRSRSSGFVKGDVKIVLDGRKLNYINKITPIDYWQFPKDRNSYDNPQSYTKVLSSSEQEDRIVSDKSVIPNAIKYIIEIHIYVETLKLALKNIIDICKNNNIKLYLYDNRKNWLNQIKPIDKNIDFSNIKEEEKFDRPNYDNFQYFTASLLAYNDQNNYDIIKNYLKDADKIKKLDEILEENTHEYFKFNSRYGDDAISIIDSRLFQIRSEYDEDSKFLLTLLVKDLKKYGVTNIKDYLFKKQHIGKKNLNDYKNKFLNELGSVMMSEFEDGLERYFPVSIEINGNEYNYGYESPEIRKVIYDYMKIIREFLKTNIFSEKYDIFGHQHLISKDYIKKYINYDDIKLSDKINITEIYYFYTIESIDEKFKDIIDLYILVPLDNFIKKNIKSFKEEYLSQFN